MIHYSGCNFQVIERQTSESLPDLVDFDDLMDFQK